MDSRAWSLSEQQLRDWLDQLVAGERDVIAPVADEDRTVFAAIAASDQAVLSGSGKTRWSPKEFVFPRTETLYRYRMNRDQIVADDPQPPTRPQVIVGVRACDAAGMVRLDETFLQSVPDTLYQRRRELTTLVSVACTGVDPECFCTAVGGSPTGTEGIDVQLFPRGEGWLLRTLTERGQSLLSDTSTDWPEAQANALGEIEEVGARLAAAIGVEPMPTRWGPLLEQGFAHPAWHAVAEHCQQCGTCAYVCPSCSCFDMNHEGNAWCGTQCRSWDACTFSLFTKHASGHNPRETKGDRYRQRVLHKFAYAGDDPEQFRCVGCGRCVAACPAGVDIVDVVHSMVAEMQQEPSNASG